MTHFMWLARFPDPLIHPTSPLLMQTKNSFFLPVSGSGGGGRDGPPGLGLEGLL